MAVLFWFEATSSNVAVVYLDCGLSVVHAYTFVKQNINNLLLSVTDPRVAGKAC